MSTFHLSIPRGAALRRTMSALEATWGSREEGSEAPGVGATTPALGGAGSRKVSGKGSGELPWVVLADGSE